MGITQHQQSTNVQKPACVSAVTSCTCTDQRVGSWYRKHCLNVANVHYCIKFMCPGIGWVLFKNVLTGACQFIFAIVPAD